MKGVEAQWDKDNGKYKLYRDYGKELAGNEIGYFMSFDCSEGEQLMLKMGVSFVSIENARRNLNAEQDGFDFEGTHQQARRHQDQSPYITHT